MALQKPPKDDGHVTEIDENGHLSNGGHVPTSDFSAPHDDVDLPSKDENEVRGNWSGQLDFLLSCLGYAVGLGNVWRFPYLCYSNGGGAFLIPYTIMLLFAGIPLFFLELVFGQYCSLGPITSWRAVPILRGIGYGMMAVSFYVGIYYNVIITYTIRYMFASLTKSLPWVGCDHAWNSVFNCAEMVQDCVHGNGTFVTFNNTCAYMSDYSEAELAMYNISAGGDKSLYVDPFREERVGASEEFYLYEALQRSDSINDTGYVVWELGLCLLLAWGIVFVCLAKGIKSSGKVVYFTATFPYVVLIILLIKGLTLDGHQEGIKYFITPQWHRLKDPKVWKDAAVQIFYSLSASWGGLITLASYNKFRNNCFRDAMIIPILNCLTSLLAGFVIFSIIGYMAQQLDKPIEDVVTQSFGLAFIAYPSAVASLPGAPVWAFLFFFMLLTLGLDSQFVIVETIITAVIDEYPKQLRKKKLYVLGAFCSFSFFIGLLCVSQAGNYWVALIDSYVANPILLYGLGECIGIAWLYGYKRFVNDIRTMVGDRIVDSPLFYWWPLNWLAITPVILSAVVLFDWANWTAPTVGDSDFPDWAHVIGWFLYATAVVPIPGLAIYDFIKQKGSALDRLKVMASSTDTWGPALVDHRREAFEVHQRNGTTMGGDPDLDPQAMIDYSYDGKVTYDDVNGVQV
ncbi:sodium- and chloride-dependent neutral and basic amino acid transporter B(0+)-like isoform X2 [Antedon mediterranea]|uniref:sodium- and chloride-dependent neutral and basic amino acid transporter B(0+)-like isoform X2 n=1 Tax=Antedon mediterranea TaxID=105859 RepID=UPI003AF8B666